MVHYNTSLYKKKSSFIYNFSFFVCIVLFIIIVFFGDYLGGLLSPLVLFVTILGVFASYKFGFYGPYYFLFALIPFSQSVTLFSIAGRPVNMGMHTMVVLMILIATILRKSLMFYTLKDSSVKYLIFLGFWTLYTIIVSMSYAPASALSNSFITWMRWVQFIPIVYLLVHSVGISKYFRSLVYLIVFLGFVVAVWGIFETLNPSEFASRAFRGAATFTKPLFRELDEAASFSISNKTSDGDWYSGSANYNIAGAFMSVVTLISIPFLVGRKKYKGIPIWNISIAVLIIGILVTQSRSSLVAFIIGLLVNSNKKSKKALIYTIITLILLTAIFMIFFSDYWLGPMIKEMYLYLPEATTMALEVGEYTEGEGFSVNVYGAAMRLVGIREAFVGFMIHPISGWGFFTFSTFAPNLGTAENFYMQFLCETGLVGLLAFFQYLRCIWRNTNTKFAKGTFADKYQLGFKSAFVSFIIVNITGTLFYDTRIWGLMLVLGAIQVRLVMDEKKRIEKEINI